MYGTLQSRTGESLSRIKWFDRFQWVILRFEANPLVALGVLAAAVLFRETLPTLMVFATLYPAITIIAVLGGVPMATGTMLIAGPFAMWAFNAQIAGFAWTWQEMIDILVFWLACGVNLL